MTDSTAASVRGRTGPIRRRYPCVIRVRGVVESVIWALRSRSGRGERSEVQVGCQVAQGGSPFRRVRQSAEGRLVVCQVLLDPAQGIVARQVAGDHEGPVARLERQELSGGALERRARLAMPGDRGHRAELRTAGGEDELRDRGRVPGREVLAGAPGGCP